MNCNHFTRLTGSKRYLLALLASSAVFTAGCANMATTATSSNPLSVASVGGRVHGGNQPVGGAVVNLYYAGQTGMGSGDPSAGSGLGAPILAATTTSANDGSGSFSFIQDPVSGDTTTGNTFSCPANNPVVYVVARGGNTLNTQDPTVNNAASAFIGVYGLCSQLSSAGFIDLSEVTTVATVAALQQYFNPVTESIGADGIAASKQALVNSVATISNMVNLATGTAVTSQQISGASAYLGNGATGVTVTAMPSTAKINQLANIISACVNNASATNASACTTLFANATPPNTATTSRPYHTPAFAPATDVLQAAYYMLTNPTNGSTANLQNLFNLAPAVGAPYQPTLPAAPTDWTISITYSSNSTCGTNGGNFVYKPQALSVDINGNLWISNGQPGTGNLTEISASGVPTTCLPLGASSGAAIDTLGNIWYATTDSNNIYRYSPGTTLGVSQGLLAFPTTQTPLAVAADGAGNVYFSTSTDNSLYEIPGGASAAAVVAPVQISSVLGPLPISLMADKTGSIWASSGSNFISRVTTGSAGDPNFLNGFSTTPFNTPANTYGIALTSSNNVFVSSTGTNSSLSYFTGSGVSYGSASGWPTAAGLGGINNPASVVLDGAQNVWTANNSNDSVSGLDSVSEISFLGANLTPNGTTAGGLQLSSSVASGRSIIVDQSGNVWVSGDGTLANPSNFVTEIVGGGVPVYQPYAVGLANGRFQDMP